MVPIQNFDELHIIIYDHRTLEVNQFQEGKLVAIKLMRQPVRLLSLRGPQFLGKPCERTSAGRQILVQACQACQALQTLSSLGKWW